MTPLARIRSVLVATIVAVVVSAVPASAQFAHVQTFGTDTLATSLNSWNSGTGVSVTSGHHLCVGTRFATGGATISSVTDNASNTYTFKAGVTADGVRLEAWCAFVVTGNASLVVTVTPTAPVDYASVIVEDFTSTVTATVDGTNTGSATGVGAVTSGSFSTTHTSGYLLAFSDVSITGNTWTPDTGFSTGGQDPSHVVYAQYKVVASTQTGVTVTATSSATNDKRIVALGLGESSGGGGGTACTRSLLGVGC